MAKTWQQMTRRERRIAVAKDVVADILAARYEVRQGYSYVRSDAAPETLDGQEWAEQLGYCTVCARGALMVTKLRNYDNWKADDVIGRPPSFTHTRVEPVETTLALHDCFSEAQLLVIERYFERDQWSDTHCADDRLLAIMQNIVDHDGRFVPSVEYEIVNGVP
jgi:hypothetical protein